MKPDQIGMLTGARIRHPGGWPVPGAWQGDLGEIGGRTVGLVGCGAVPRRLVPVLEALGAREIYANRRDAGVPYARVDKATCWPRRTSSRCTSPGPRRPSAGRAPTPSRR